MSRKDPHAFACAPREGSAELSFGEPELLALLHIPDPDCLIHPTRSNQISPRVPRQTKHGAQMTIQYPHSSLPLLMLAARGSFDFPDADGAVV